MTIWILDGSTVWTSTYQYQSIWNRSAIKVICYSSAANVRRRAGTSGAVRGRRNYEDIVNLSNVREAQCFAFFLHGYLRARRRRHVTAAQCVYCRLWVCRSEGLQVVDAGAGGRSTVMKSWRDADNRQPAADYAPITAKSYVIKTSQNWKWVMVILY